MKVFKVGVIGLGNISPMHLVSITKNPHCKLVAVCDNKPDRLQKAVDKYGVRGYADYHELIADKEIEVVHICTPHYLHAPMAIEAMNAKKHVLTEKPMSIKYEDGVAMVEAAKRNGVTLGVIFQNRYNPGSQLLKKAIASGELGKIYAGKLEVTWQRTDEYYSRSDWKGTWDKEGGGVVIDQSIHTMDLLNWLIDDEIDYVDADIANRGHEIIQVEDTANGIIKYKNGVISSFNAINYYSYDAPVRIELHCEKGIATMVKDTAEIKYNDGRTATAGPNPNENMDYGDGIKKYWGVSHNKQIENYYDSLEKGVQPDINGEVGLRTQRFICAIYDSGKTKKRIEF